VSLNLTECHLAELLREKFIKEHSVANQQTTEKEAKLTGAAPSLIELVTLCSIHYLVEPLAMTAFSLLSILQWTY